MFEKEADFAETKMLINCNGDYSKKKDYKKGWQDGAEFGYNKAFVEADKNLKAVVADFNKANEWHEIESKVTPKREISKQYMPKSKEKVLLKYHFSGDDEVHISDGYYDAYDSEFYIANNPKFRTVCVIAWKEL